MGELRSPGKLKHSPPMRRSRLEMSIVQVRATLAYGRRKRLPHLYPLATLQLPACNLPVAPAGEPADQNSDTIPQGSPNRALLFATTLIISFCKPAQWR